MSNPGIDALDSYYQFVKTRILTRNAQRVVAGMLNAQDWPPKQIKLEAFYLLVLGEEPVGRQGFSPAVPIKFHLVQWTWIIKGSDLQQGTRAANRGDRYRIMQEMKDELTTGMFPNYSEKQTWALDTNQTPAKWSPTSLIPPMFITWTPVSYHERFDKDSGIAYGTGSTRIQDIREPIIS